MCVSLKHLLLCFPAGARVRGRGGHPAAQGALAGTMGAASDTPTHEGAGGSSHARQCPQHSHVLHSSQPASASCQTPCLELQLLWNPRKVRRFINWTDMNFSFFLCNEASFSKASLSAKPCSCQTLWKQRAEAVRSEPFLSTKQICLCTSKGCSCWVHTGRAPLHHTASGPRHWFERVCHNTPAHESPAQSTCVSQVVWRREKQLGTICLLKLGWVSPVATVSTWTSRVLSCCLRQSERRAAIPSCYGVVHTHTGYW